MALGCMTRLMVACLSAGIVIPAVANDICDLYQRCLSNAEAARYIEAIQRFEQGDKQGAMVTMGEIYHEAPSNQLLANNYAVMLAAVGQHAESALVLENYLQQDPSVAEIAKNLVESYNNLSLIGTPASNMTEDLSLIQPEDTASSITGTSLSNQASSEYLPSDGFQQLAMTEHNIAQAAPLTNEAELSIVRERLSRFLAVWSAGDIESYLNFFVPDTSPVSNLSYSSWRKQRYARVKPSKQIQVSAEDIKATRQADGSISAEFTQFYRSKNYQDRVLKSLVWQNIGGDWLIVSERQR